MGFVVNKKIESYAIDRQLDQITYCTDNTRSLEYAHMCFFEIQNRDVVQSALNQMSPGTYFVEKWFDFMVRYYVDIVAAEKKQGKESEI
jgi:hypothetical protein